MAREAFLINPPRRRRRKSSAKRRRNPWRFTSTGQSEWVDEGGKPKKRRKSKKGGKTMAKRRKKATRKAAPKRRKRRAVATAPKRRRRRKSTRAVAVPRKRRRKSTKRVGRKRARRSRRVRVTVGRRVAKHGVRSVRINRPRRRRRRSNPGLMIAGSNPRRRRSGRRYRRNPLRVAGFDFMRNLPLIAAGAASVIATAAIPDYLMLTGKGPLYKYGSQLGVVAGGGFLLGKVLKKRGSAYAWMLAGSAVILADLLREYVIGSWLPSVSGYTAFPSPYTPQVVTNYSQSSDYGEGIGAFPSPYEGVGAYPSDQYGF